MQYTINMHIYKEHVYNIIYIHHIIIFLLPCIGKNHHEYQNSLNDSNHLDNITSILFSSIGKGMFFTELIVIWVLAKLK